MTTDEKIEELIRSYKYTVVLQGIIILSCVGLITWVLSVYVPETLYATLERFYANTEIEAIEYE